MGNRWGEGGVELREAIMPYPQPNNPQRFSIASYGSIGSLPIVRPPLSRDAKPESGLGELVGRVGVKVMG